MIGLLETGLGYPGLNSSQARNKPRNQTDPMCPPSFRSLLGQTFMGYKYWEMMGTKKKLGQISG